VPTLTVVTWNVGDGGTKSDLADLMARGDVLCLQEMSDRDGLYDYARDHGWKTYDAGGDNGRKATPVFWDPETMGERIDDYDVALSPKTPNCPGPGPSTVKAKWLIGIGWNVPNYPHEVRVGSMHAASGQADYQCREDLARQEFRNASEVWGGAAGLCVIAGDLNCKWDAGILDPFRDRGWKPSQGTCNGPHTTHGKSWTPDQQWRRNGKPTDSGTVKTGSDHRAYWVAYEI
jgi:hypothetical protein